MRTIVFYGDSNTYGYDPAGYFGGRYPEGVIWTSLVQKALGDGWKVVNRGMNGRQIPYGDIGFAYAETLLKGLKKTDIFAVMLGTNDILMTDRPDAGAAVIKMDMFLEWLTARHPAENVLLIAPPQVGRENEPDAMYRKYREEVKKMNAGFAQLARQRGVKFVDSSAWDPELAFDLDHLSEDGHRTFAEKMTEYLKGEYHGTF